MFVAMNRIEIKPEHSDEVEQLFQRNAQLMKACPGFLSMTLLRVRTSPSSRQVYVLWESVDAYENYKKSDVFRQTHAGVNFTWFTGPPKVEKMDVVFTLSGDSAGQ